MLGEIVFNPAMSRSGAISIRSQDPAARHRHMGRHCKQRRAGHQGGLGELRVHDAAAGRLPRPASREGAPAGPKPLPLHPRESAPAVGPGSQK